jgi:hypothetical protein
VGTVSSAAALTGFTLHCLASVQKVTLDDQNDQARDDSNSEQDQGE